MIKIVFIVSTLRVGGPTNQLYYLIKHLDRTRFEPHLITLTPEPKQDSRWADFEALHSQLHTLGLPRLKGLFFSKKYMRSLVDRIRPDVIHTQGIRADLLNASILKQYPSLCTSRNYPFADYPTKFGILRGSLMARQHMAAFKKLHVVACSLSIQSQLKSHSINASVVQNGVDTEKFQPVSSESKKALRQKLGLPEAAFVALSAGSLIPRKDMFTLIEAFEQAGLAAAKLVILGDGPQKDALRQQANDNVLMPGNVANVSDYLGAADLFVSAALSEGLPNTVLEAMACGLPCILSDIPPHRELFRDSDDIFFRCKDATSLADRLTLIDMEGLVERGQKARRFVEEFFSAQMMSLGYQETYMRLIEDPNG